MENEEYDFKDIICFLFDMFEPDKNYFVKSDFYKKPYWACTFFDLLTNYQKCYEILQKDTNIIPIKREFSEWTSFALKKYNELVYGYNPEEDAEDGEMGEELLAEDLDFNISTNEV
jgi:hypothetical protein